MANILVLDIGNSNTKCFVYHVERVSQKPNDKISATKIYEKIEPTPRGHLWDLCDIVKNMFDAAIRIHAPKYGIVVGFGDAFVHYDPAENGRPQYVFADEPVEDYELDTDYSTVGFPTGAIEITGVRSLRAKHRAEWTDIVPINIAIGREVGGNSSWRAWDITQASATGEYNLVAKEWFNKDGIEPCQPHDEVGMYKGMSILAGGLDNAFLDTTETTPYIVAGTWLVVSTVYDVFDPTDTQRKQGVRWFLSGNGNYLAQTVRRSIKPIPVELSESIISDLQAMSGRLPSYNSGETQKIRCCGGYSKELVRKLNSVSNEQYMNLHFVDSNQDLGCVAIYAYKHKEDMIE